MTAGLVQTVLLIIALLAIIVGLRAMGREVRASNPVARQLAIIYRLVAALLLCRLLVTGLSGMARSTASVALMTVAAWLPLAGLRFAEELVRRHAPRAAKLLVLGGAGLFTIVAVTVGFVWSAAATASLAAYQAVTLSVMVVHLVANRNGLSRGEKATADTFLLAIAATIPLALSDFHSLFPELPVRFGSFAVLLFVLATSRLVEGGDAPKRLLRDMLMCLAGGGLAALASRGSLEATSFGVALAALAILTERFARNRDSADSLVGSLARAENGDQAALLASHPILATGRIVPDEALTSYPARTVEALAREQVISDVTPHPELREAIEDLLQALGATHLVRLSRQPPRFLAVSAGGFATQRLSDELTLLARILESKS